MRKLEKLGSSMVNNYQRLLLIKKIIKSICGEVMMTEVLAWKVHKEDLIFEMEAVQNIENLRVIAQKSSMDK